MDAKPLYETLYERILNGCTPMSNGDVAISAKLDLMPEAGFDLNKLMPPTYKDGETTIHHFEKRMNEKGEVEEIVILDQPQSTANRIEKAAMQATAAGMIKLSDIKVNVASANMTLSAMETPHRAFSAIHQASNFQGNAFVRTAVGKALFGEDLRIAMRTMVEYNVLSMVLGCWASRVKGKSLKFPRLVFNEIIAGVASQTKKSASCSDPLNLSNCLEIEIDKGKYQPWRVASLKEIDKGFDQSKYPELKEKAEKAKGKKAKTEEDANDVNDENEPKGKKEAKKMISEAGLGNATVPNVATGGVSVKWIKDCFTLSLQRSQRYETGNGQEDCHVRAMLCCLGLYLFLLKSQNYDLRSGCSLKRKTEKTTFYFEKYEVSDPVDISIETAAAMYARSLVPLEGVLEFKELTLDANAHLEALAYQSRV